MVSYIKNDMRTYGRISPRHTVRYLGVALSEGLSWVATFILMMETDLPSETLCLEEPKTNELSPT
jgi:hypothetical protein